MLAAVTLRIRHDGRAIRQLRCIAVKDNAIAVHGHGSELSGCRKRHHIASVIVIVANRSDYLQTQCHFTNCMQFVQILKSSTSGNANVCFSVNLSCLSCLPVRYSLTCMANVTLYSAPDMVARLHCAGSSSRDNKITTTSAVVVAAFSTFPFSLCCN